VHIEILSEDSSGEKLLSNLVPRIIGQHGDPHTWRIHSYKGIGRIPKGLNKVGDPSKRILLDQLPRLLQGYGKTAGVDVVVVVVVADTDTKNCAEFLAELNALLEKCHPKPPKTLFRLAIEEMESWLLGDKAAINLAYPKAKSDILAKYKQDSVCGTWEVLADAIYPNGSSAVKKAGWPLPGQLKHEWTQNIAPLMDLENNASPSFNKFKEGLIKLIS